MTEADLDAAFARVFATPDGIALLAELSRRGWRNMPILQVNERVDRMRARWAQGEGVIPRSA